MASFGWSFTACCALPSAAASRRFAGVWPSPLCGTFRGRPGRLLYIKDAVGVSRSFSFCSPPFATEPRSKVSKSSLVSAESSAFFQSVRVLSANCQSWASLA